MRSTHISYHIYPSWMRLFCLPRTPIVWYSWGTDRIVDGSKPRRRIAKGTTNLASICRRYPSIALLLDIIVPSIRYEPTNRIVTKVHVNRRVFASAMLPRAPISSRLDHEKDSVPSVSAFGHSISRVES